MRKIIISFAFLAFIMLGMTTVAHATVKLYFNVTLTDTCSPSGYHGYYDVEVKVTLNGTVIGTAICTNVKVGGPTCYEFDYDIGDAVTDPDYGLILVGASRAGGACVSVVNQPIISGLYWYYLTSCNSVVQINVTI
jgi:hypothetical protein